MERQEQSERDQEDGPWDKEEERARPPGGTSLQVLPHLLTCIASFNLPSPGDLGTLSTVCSEGTGPRASKEQVRKSPGLHSRKRRVGKARPSHLNPTFCPGGAPGGLSSCRRPSGLQTESGRLENRAERADPC